MYKAYALSKVVDFFSFFYYTNVLVPPRSHRHSGMRKRLRVDRNICNTTSGATYDPIASTAALGHGPNFQPRDPLLRPG